MSSRIALLLLPFLLSFSNTEYPVSKQWQVTDNSKFEITGTTNINSFSCVSLGFDSRNTMRELQQCETTNPVFNGEIAMRAAGFDCHNSVMTRDFAETVRADHYPEITIRFISLIRTDYAQQVGNLNGKVEIALAGKKMIYQVACQIFEENDSLKYLVGNRTFKFSDFGLEPPSKLMGAIRVKDEVTVQFDIELKG